MTACPRRPMKFLVGTADSSRGSSPSTCSQRHWVTKVTLQATNGKEAALHHVPRHHRDVPYVVAVGTEKSLGAEVIEGLDNATAGTLGASWLARGIEAMGGDR
jgi:hypothetical protein